MEPLPLDYRDCLPSKLRGCWGQAKIPVTHRKGHGGDTETSMAMSAIRASTWVESSRDQT